MDSAASHSFTPDLPRLSLGAHPYQGTEEVVIGDGSGLPISHYGSSLLFTPQLKFLLKNLLHTPTISKNLIFVHRFYVDNNVFIEFHPNFFLVKDQVTKATLLRGLVENDMYILPALSPPSSSSLSSQPRALSTTTRDVYVWHSRCGHPTATTTKKILKKINLSISQDFPTHFEC